MIRCAIYTRVSTANQADKEYNSCEAQRDRILSYIKSQEDLKLYREYSDPGFSASTIERPAFKELLHDISERKIDAAVFVLHVAIANFLRCRLKKKQYQKKYSLKNQRVFF